MNSPCVSGTTRNRLIGAVLSLIPLTVPAADSTDLTFEAAIGARYDSRLSVDELDTFSNTGDLAFLASAEAKLRHSLTDDTDISLGYKVSQKTFDDQGTFDTQNHFLSFDASHDVGAFDIGFAYRHLNSRLDGNLFLTYRQAAPYVTWSVGQRLFFRSELGLARKDFDIDNARDADVNSLSVDGFWFLNGSKTYVLAGYRRNHEDAIDDQFDHDSDHVKLHFVKRLPWFTEEPLKLDLGWRYELRDYSAETPSIGAIRDESRHKLRAELEVPLSERFRTEFRYEYRHIDSNVGTVDGTTNYVLLELIATF